MKEQIRAKFYWYLNFPMWKCVILFLCILGVFLIYEKIFFSNRKWYISVYWSIYLTAVLSITFLGRKLGMAENSIEKIFLTYQLISQGKTNILYEVVFNVLLFVPWGILCCVERYSLIISFTFGGLFSLGIEIVQLFTGLGLFEICDLINNAVGVLIGYFFYFYWSKIFRDKTQINS